MIKVQPQVLLNAMFRAAQTPRQQHLAKVLRENQETFWIDTDGGIHIRMDHPKVIGRINRLSELLRNFRT